MYGSRQTSRLGSLVWGLGVKVWGCGVWGVGFGVEGFRVEGSGALGIPRDSINID